VSIGSVQSNSWPDPWAQAASAQSGSAQAAQDGTSASTGVGSAQGSFGPPTPSGPWSNQSGSATGSASANPLQNLANDIQAMLIQAQASSATQTAGTAAATSATQTAGTQTATTTGATTSVSLEQQTATDLQTLMSDLQASTSAPPTAQTASTNPADPTGQTEPHHHHHHHGGGEASGASPASGTTASSTTPAAESPTSSSDQQVSQVFAADIEQALQAYSGTAAATAMPSLTV